MAFSFIKNYSLNEYGDEHNLSPFEKRLRTQFFSEENKKKIFSMAQRSIDAFITFGNAVEEMYDTFDNAMHLTPSTVEELNNICIEQMRKKKNLCQQGTLRERNKFIRANIPTNFLPRASFKLQEESNDDIIEFDIIKR